MFTTKNALNYDICLLFYKLMNNKQNLIKILSDILILPNLQTVSTKENQIESAVAVILKNTNTAIPQSNTKFEILEEQINYLLQT